MLEKIFLLLLAPFLLLFSDAFRILHLYLQLCQVWVILQLKNENFETVADTSFKKQIGFSSAYVFPL